MAKLSAPLERARSEIADRIGNACRDGRQSEQLRLSGYYACGQYLDHPTNRQRGLHGTAAAIRVLASSPDPESRAILGGLIRYVRDRDTLERDDQRILEKVQRDGSNVVKQSELLYALSCVADVIEDAPPLRRHVANGLLECRTTGGRGWAYFGDAESPAPDPLPTALAVQALARCGYREELREPLHYLREVIGKEGGASTDVFIKVQCLFVLSYLPPEYLTVKESDCVKASLRDAWADLEKLLDHDVEANVEYTWGDNNHLYVRVPWQLMLVAATARHFPSRFWSVKAQRRLLHAAQAAATPAGFIYPHSGRRQSSRTYAILFDITEKVTEELKTARLRFGQAYRPVDVLRTLALTPPVLVGAFSIGLLSVVWGASRIVSQQDGAMAEVAMTLLLNIASGLVLMIVSLSKR